MSRRLRSSPEDGPAWRAAEAYGFDMSVIESNLRRTPRERIRVHNRELQTTAQLKEAMEKRRAGS